MEKPPAEKMESKKELVKIFIRENNGTLTPLEVESHGIELVDGKPVLRFKPIDAAYSGHTYRADYINGQWVAEPMD